MLGLKRSHLIWLMEPRLVVLSRTKQKVVTQVEGVTALE